MILRELQGYAVAEEHETRSAEKLRRFLARVRECDARDAKRFARLLVPLGDILLRDEAGPGAVQHEVALLQSGKNILAALDDLELGETLHQHLSHAIVHAAGPEPDFRIRHVLFQQMQHPRRVRDVADVHRLPRGTQDDARRSFFLCSDAAKRGDKGRGEKVAAVHAATTRRTFQKMQGGSYL